MDAQITNTTSEYVFIPGPNLNLAPTGDPDGNDVRTWPDIIVGDLDSNITLKGYVIDGTVTVSLLEDAEDAATPTQGSMSAWALPKYEVADLPTGYEGRLAFATDGRKTGETTGNGTGVPVYFSGGTWNVFFDDSTVAV